MKGSWRAPLSLTVLSGCLSSPQELLLAFQEEAQLTLRPRLLLSAAVSGDPNIIQTAYDVPRLGR